MKKLAFFILVAITICGCLTVQEKKERKIFDMANREITIPFEIKRVVVLNSETMSLMKALKVDVKILGATHYAFENPVVSKLYNMSEILDIGPGSRPNVEAIVSLNPDLVIAYYCGESTRYGYEIPAEDVKKLESAGIPVVGICLAVTKPADIEEYNRHIRLIGEIFSKEREAEELISFLEEIRDQVAQYLEKIPRERRVKVVYTYNEQNRIAGNSTVMHVILEMAGGINVGRNISQPYATVSHEFIVESNPEVWVIWRSAKYEVEDVIKNPVFSKIDAVKNSKVYKEPKILFSTWEPIIAHVLILWNAKNFYPELPLDYEVIANNVFELYYGIKYSEVAQ